MREFLLEKYGDDYLNEGDVILDVAGGKVRRSQSSWPIFVLNV